MRASHLRHGPAARLSCPGSVAVRPERRGLALRLAASQTLVASCLSAVPMESAVTLESVWRPLAKPTGVEAKRSPSGIGKLAVDIGKCNRPSRKAGLLRHGGHGQLGPVPCCFGNRKYKATGAQCSIAPTQRGTIAGFASDG